MIKKPKHLFLIIFIMTILLTISLTSCNKKRIFTVQVKNSLTVDDEEEINITFNKKEDELTITSSDEKVFIIENQTIKAIGAGEATLKLKGKTGHEIEIIITVNEKLPVVFTINGLSEMNIGDNQILEYVFEDTSLSESISLISNDPNIIQVIDNNKIMALSVGTTKVVATSTSNYQQELTINVLPQEPLSFIIIGNNTMNACERQTLNYQFSRENEQETITLTTSDKDIIGVLSNNEIIARKEGTAIITATSATGHIETINITIGPKIPADFTLLGFTTMDTLTTQSLVFRFENDDVKEEVTLETSDSEIVALVGGNRVKAMNPGTAIITATATGGYQHQITIVVNKKIRTYSISYNLTEEEESFLPSDAPTSFKDNELPISLPKLVNTNDPNYTFLGWKINDTLVRPYEDPENLFFELSVDVNYKVLLTPVWGLSRLNLIFNETPILAPNTTYQIGLEIMNIPKNIDKTAIIWQSSNEQVATVDQNGLVTGITNGKVDISAVLKEMPSVNMTVGLTIDERVGQMDDILQYFIDNAITTIIAKKIGVTGYQFNYPHVLLSSVTNYLFEDFNTVEKIIPITNDNRPGTVKPKYYVTVHDTASSAINADGASHADYVYGGGGGTSWHYSVGNDGIYHQIPDNEVAYHAGDGTGVSYSLTPTGVNATIKYPLVTISTDGYYELNGEKTTIIAPRYIRYQKTSDGEYVRDADGNKIEIANRLCVTSDINDVGIEIIIKNGEYYMGPTYFNDTYAKISNRGGNNNSIGIETCVNQGSDLYYTWQKTAKLVAHLCKDNNIALDHVRPHHFFSGKNCPQTMRDNGLWDNFLKLVEMEYNMITTYKDYSISFKSLNPEYLNDLGRIIAQPEYSTTVRYQIIVKSGDLQKTLELTTIIPGKNTIN